LIAVPEVWLELCLLSPARARSITARTVCACG